MPTSDAPSSIREVTAASLASVLDPINHSASQSHSEGPSAAVAAVFRSGSDGTELLFIQRATKSSDPWSGHMAFPGGRRDKTDTDSHHTAERETLEEVGLDLTGAERLGSLRDLDGGRERNNLFAVHGHAYWLAGTPPELTPNYEVADALWVPLAVLVDQQRYIDYYYPVSDSSWPGIQLDHPGQVVWGLTLRFLADLFGRLDVDFITLAPLSGDRS